MDKYTEKSGRHPRSGLSARVRPDQADFRSYHVLNEEGIAYRGQFLIDKQGIIRHQLVNDLPLGRSIEEALRLLDALISYETHGEVLPANWKAGEKTFKANLEDLVTYFTVK